MAVYIILLLIGCLALQAAIVSGRVDRIRRGLARIERKTDLILDHLGIDPGPDRDRIHALLRDGKTIHAVKLYRDQTGVSLTEAAQAVKQMAARGSPAGSWEGRRDERRP